MKRTLSIVLAALMVLSLFCFTGCGAVNENEVSILWSGNGKVENPNSLINSMERAMYLKNVEYKHYGANGDEETQLSQAKSALAAGCEVLVVELTGNILTNQLLAASIIDEAKEKNTPVVFFNCLIDENIIEAYDKCFLITSDISTVADVQGEMIAAYVKANFAKLDKDENGKLEYTARGLLYIGDAVEKANALLATDDYKVKDADGNKINTTIELAEIQLLKSELILTDSDATAAEVLKELQKDGYNAGQLTTHYIPVFTIGDTVDYKGMVVSARPQIPADLVIGENDSDKVVKQKDKAIKKLADLQTYYDNNKYLVDLTAVNESDLAEMIYTTLNVIDAGRLTGTVTEDKDALAMAVAGVVRNLVKGNTATDGVASKVKEGEIPSVTVDGQIVKVRYISYTQG